MWFRFLSLSFAGVAAAATVGTASSHDGLKIVTHETFPAGTTETTTYITDDRVRVETRRIMQVPGGPAAGHEYVHIRRCDLNTIFVLNPAERTYEVGPLQMKLTALERFTLWFARPDHDLTGDADLVVETTTVDTGERKRAFGRPARHVITTRKDIPAERPDAATEMVTDGWYIDLETRTTCERRETGRAILVAVASPGDARRNRPRVTFKDVGTPEKGFAVEATTTWRVPGDGPKRQTSSMVTQTTVVDLSAQPIEASVFDVPDGFRSSNDGMFASVGARWSRAAHIVHSVVSSWFH